MSRRKRALLQQKQRKKRNRKPQVTKKITINLSLWMQPVIIGCIFYI